MNNWDTLLMELRKNKKYLNYLTVENEATKLNFKEEIKIAVVRNFTFEMIVPVISGEIALLGYKPNVLMGNYDNISQELYRDDSTIYTFRPDIIIIALWLDNISPRISKGFLSMTSAEIKEESARILSNITSYIKAIKENTNSVVLINNFILPQLPDQGIFDINSKNSQLEIILDLNKNIADIARKYTDVYVIDFLSLFARYGYEGSFNAKTWMSSKSPFKDKILVPLGQEYGKYFRAIKGKNKKCLVIDCDNTIWGGNVGELGPHGILIGKDYPGNCYYYLQQEILNLYNKGIILALCSKNNEGDVLEALKENEEMLLREKHFSVCRINWNDKASNIISIAEELNIGLDSIVFMDDSDFECNLIINQLPQVEVLNLNMDPSQFAGQLRAFGMFDMLAFTEEDKNRTEMYKADVNRKNLQSQSLSLTDYLRSLEMKAAIAANNLDLVARITQLTQKTNQFNLTTIRYTQEKISEFMNNPQYDVLSMRLTDKVSDLGIIGVGIVHYEKNCAYVDSFILSCRAIGRNVEYVLMNQIINMARSKKCDKIIGKYIPTNKNVLTEDLYPNFGFQLIENNNGITLWEASLDVLEINVPDYIHNIMN